MEQEQDMTNGFPRLSMHDLKDVYRLGTLARRWAEAPLALSPQELEEYQTLCDRYELRGTEVLMEFQRMVYAEINRDQSPVRFSPLPVPGTTSGPRPSPHPRHEVDETRQSRIDDGHVPGATPDDQGHWEPGSGDWHSGEAKNCSGSICNNGHPEDLERPV